MALFLDLAQHRDGGVLPVEREIFPVSMVYNTQPRDLLGVKTREAYDRRSQETLREYEKREREREKTVVPDVRILAALDLVEYIRNNEIKNETVRIILRTGQPGQAPERGAIASTISTTTRRRTSPTADKLFTSLTAAPRSYQSSSAGADPARPGNHHRCRLDAARFQIDQRLAEARRPRSPRPNVDRAGTWRRAPPARSATLFGAGGRRPRQPLQRRRRSKSSTDRADGKPPPSGASMNLSMTAACHVRTGSGREVVVLLQAEREPSETDRSLVEIFGSRPSIASTMSFFISSCTRPTPSSRTASRSALAP